ncbi:MAG: type II CAAX endopeptidase family protein [Bacteroidota bacterium]|nr:type II CAAX endopeptidase family protein [Bacteroidota bacterium]
MKWKDIFVNSELNYLRSGWRIGIFLLITTVCSIGIAAPIGALLKRIPDFNVQTPGTYIAYFTMTVAGWLVLRFIDKRPFVSIGLRLQTHSGKELFQGLLLGSGMMSLIFVFEYSFGMVHIEFRDITIQQGLLIFLNSILLYIAVGYGEEFLFRGYIFQVFVEGTNKTIATLTIALLFAFAHFKNPNVSLFGLINVGLAGIWLSIAYFKTKALWLPIGLHISWNFFQGFVYSFPVSGTTSDKEQIGKAIVSGPEWLTGGAFGPEGGALATIMLIIGTFVIVQWKWITTAEGFWSYEQWREDRKQSLIPQTQDTP